MDQIIVQEKLAALRDHVEWHIRNIATHSYVKLDLRIIHTACTHHLGVFRSFATQIGQHAGLVDRSSHGADKKSAAKGRAS